MLFLLMPESSMEKSTPAMEIQSTEIEVED